MSKEYIDLTAEQIDILSSCLSNFSATIGEENTKEHPFCIEIALEKEQDKYIDLIKLIEQNRLCIKPKEEKHIPTPTNHVPTKEQLQERKFKVGDRVRFKTWGQMAKEYQADDDAIYLPDNNLFLHKMCHLCGAEATILLIDDNYIFLDKFNTYGRIDWMYTKDMVEKI